MGFLVYFYDDHQRGNPECPRCAASIAVLVREDVAEEGEAAPRPCTATVDGAPCGGLLHMDAEVLQPRGGLAIVEQCDRCGAQG